MEESKSLESSAPKRRSRADRQAKPAEPNSENKTLYVGGLKPGISSQQVYDYFADHKFSVVKGKIRVSSKDYSNVFGIVNFCSHAEAQKALDSLNNTDLDGCNIRIMWFNQNLMSKEREQANIYVKDLHSSITQKDLSDKFSEFGTILSVKLETFANKESRGYGYVQFDEREQAVKAIQEMDGTLWNGKTITV